MVQSNSSVARLIPADEVLRVLGISRTTLYRGVRAGTLPSPVKISTRRVGWRSGDIDRLVVGNGNCEVQL